jgi:hypothetical protein
LPNVICGSLGPTPPFLIVLGATEALLAGQGWGTAGGSGIFAAAAIGAIGGAEVETHPDELSVGGK